MVDSSVTTVRDGILPLEAYRNPALMLTEQTSFMATTVTSAAGVLLGLVMGLSAMPASAMMTLFSGDRHASDLSIPSYLVIRN
jgi:hypothetical protein